MENSINSGDKVLITFPEVISANTKLAKGQMAYIRNREAFPDKEGHPDNEPILYIGNGFDSIPNPPHEFSGDPAVLRPVNVADGAIRTEKLADNAVTFQKLNAKLQSFIEDVCEKTGLTLANYQITDT